MLRMLAARDGVTSRALSERLGVASSNGWRRLTQSKKIDEIEETARALGYRIEVRAVKIRET
jgi:hypothetical protein